MTRATLRQRLCGLKKKDRAKLRRTEDEVIAIAARASHEQLVIWMPMAPKAHPIVHEGRLAWCVVNEEDGRFVSPASAVFIDDETGEILAVQRFPR